MSYREMSNREGNSARFAEMSAHGMSDVVIAAYAQDFGIKVTAEDVRSIVRTRDTMGSKPIPKSFVQDAKQKHDMVQTMFNTAAQPQSVPDVVQDL